MSSSGETSATRFQPDLTRIPWTDEWHARADLVVLVIVTGLLGLIAGLGGVIVGLCIAALWLVLPNIAVFVVGQLLVAALVPAGSMSPLRWLPVVALGGFLFTTTVSETRLRDGILTVLAWASLVAVVGGVYVRTDSLWLASGVLVVIGVAGFISLSLLSATRTEGTLR